MASVELNPPPVSELEKARLLMMAPGGPVRLH